MTSTTPLQNESSLLTRTSVSPEFKRFFTNTPGPTSGGDVIRIESSFVHAPLPEQYKEIEEVIANQQRNSKRVAALARARQRLSEKAIVDGKVTLTSLRLQAGLSQAALAEKIGNSQPSYSKIESGKTEAMFSTYEALISALGVTRDMLTESLNNTRPGSIKND